MGLFSKLKESNHKRTQTRSSLFLSTDSVTSNTSSETSNYKHPIHSKGVSISLQPQNHSNLKPGLHQSGHYNNKKLPKILPDQRQQASHSRSNSSQENELPLVGLSDDTLQFDGKDISLDEATEQLIGHNLFTITENKPRPVSYIPSGTNKSRYIDPTDEDHYSILHSHEVQLNESDTTKTLTEAHAEIQTPNNDLNLMQPSQSQILNEQPISEPISHNRPVTMDSEPMNAHYDVNSLFSYPNTPSKHSRQSSELKLNEIRTPQQLKIRGPDQHRVQQYPQNRQLGQPSQSKSQPQEEDVLRTMQGQTSRPMSVQLPIQSQNQPFNYNQTYQSSPQFYSGPPVDTASKEENFKEEERESSDYNSSALSSDEDEGESLSTGSNVVPTQHPYYEQWRRYYEALAAQQQFIMRQQQQQMNPNGYPGFNPMMFCGNQQMMQQMQIPMQTQMQMPYFYNPTMTQSLLQVGAQPESNNVGIDIQQQQRASKIALPQPAQEKSRRRQVERRSSTSSIQQPLKVTPSPSSRRNSYVSVARTASELPTNEPPIKNDYLLSYKKSRNLQSEKIEEDNELISNSRRSTVKSNRYASAPLNFSKERRMSDLGGFNARVTSLELNFKPVEYRPYNEDEEYFNSRAQSRAISSSQSSPSLTQSTQHLAKLKLQDSDGQLSRQISDYSKFLFDDSSDYGSEDDNEENSHENQEFEEEEDIPRRVDIIGHSRKHSSREFSPNDQLLTPTSEEGLSRNGTAASYNSIERGGSSKFAVADIKRKLIVAGSNDTGNKSKKKDKKSKNQSNKDKNQPTGYPFNPNMSMPELHMGAMMPMQMQMQMPLAPPPPPQFGGSTDHFMMMNYSNPLLSQQTEYVGGRSTPKSRRQSIATTDSKRRSMMTESTPSPKSNKRNSAPVFTNQQKQQLSQQLQKSKKKSASPSPPKVQDSTINKKIEQFIQLRSHIAAGNKSAEYRLHWVKMLISATNYRLYAYINIKGEGIQPQQQASNRAQFIKSAVTHINKLIKEFASGVQEKDGVRCEAYFIYASLWKQDYLTSYNQDFNMDRNLEKAIEYYEKVLSINENDFKALYKLGEIYEYDLNDFNRAVKYYTNSAKAGYNRAILKMAMFYLQVPELRSIKYFKYLKNLSNVDFNEVQLDEEDLEEMEEIIGLACYELGKIFEGIYPGDLTTEDDFIKKSLDLAPVNYAKSLTYYNKSAKLNCLLAQVKLGIVYEKGELNRQQNANKSIQWYIKASSSPLAFRRHPDAMVGLARWCLHGSEGASKHIPQAMPDRAVIWCERAISEFNSPDAMLFMGELCELGIARGKGKATYWFEKAYKFGNQEAGQKLGYI